MIAGIIVGLTVLAAVAYLVQRAVRALPTQRDQAGCGQDSCGCGRKG